LTTAELPGRIAGADGLVVRSTKVDHAVFEAADKLALVIRAGAGTNTIDIDVAARNGVLVCNVPGRNAVAVAELTMGDPGPRPQDRRQRGRRAAGPLGEVDLRQG
jgi:D-3-phosphoglycerate dehydrogenase